MTTTKERIAARLEQAFSENGFAELGIADLRAAADVSLRTLYKHFPSRDAMVVEALEHRHRRYLAHVFDNLPEDGAARLEAIFARIGSWMESNSPAGCIFQNALAAQPHRQELKALLVRHKEEMGRLLAESLGLPDCEAEMRQIHEGAIQSWIFQGKEAFAIARSLTASLLRSHRHALSSGRA